MPAVCRGGRAHVEVIRTYPASTHDQRLGPHSCVLISFTGSSVASAADIARRTERRWWESHAAGGRPRALLDVTRIGLDPGETTGTSAGLTGARDPALHDLAVEDQLGLVSFVDNTVHTPDCA